MVLHLDHLSLLLEVTTRDGSTAFHYHLQCFNLGPIDFRLIPSPAPTDEPSNSLASQRPDPPNADTLHLVVKFKLGGLYLTQERNL